MGKLRADAKTRTFFDQYLKVRVSRFRADGTIDPAKNVALIPCPDGRTRLLGVTHVHFPNNGGWSLFRCPQCGRRAATLYLVDAMPRCVACCNAMGVEYRSKMGFGRATRREASDKHLDELIAKLETKERLRLNVAPASWRGKAQRVYGSRSLTKSMRKRMVSLRLAQLASQQAKDSGGLSVTRSYKPRTAALMAIPDLKAIWKARTSERLQAALDRVQRTLFQALESDDPEQRLNAAKLMMNTKQARDRGL